MTLTILSNNYPIYPFFFPRRRNRKQDQTPTPAPAPAPAPDSEFFIRERFKDFDKNNDGKIDFNEFKSDPSITQFFPAQPLDDGMPVPNTDPEAYEEWRQTMAEIRVLTV